MLNVRLIRKDGKTAIFAVNGKQVQFHATPNGWESDKFIIRWLVDEWSCRYR